MNRDPNALAEAAACFDCLSPATLNEVETFLICQWALALGPAIDTILIADDGTFIITDDGNNILIHF